MVLLSKYFAGTTGLITWQKQASIKTKHVTLFPTRHITQSPVRCVHEDLPFPLGLSVVPPKWRRHRAGQRSQWCELSWGSQLHSSGHNARSPVGLTRIGTLTEAVVSCFMVPVTTQLQTYYQTFWWNTSKLERKKYPNCCGIVNVLAK